jgi:hypothetical protein
VTELVEWLQEQLRADERHAQACQQEVGTLRTGDPYEDGSGVADRDDFPSYPWGSGRAELDYMKHPGHPSAVLRTVAAHRAILNEHRPVLTGVEWPHDTTGKGEALTCPRCQNAEHTNWNPPIGHAGVLPEGFVAPYVLAPCLTLRLLAAIYSGRPGFDPSWIAEDR